MASALPPHALPSSFGAGQGSATYANNGGTLAGTHLAGIPSFADVARRFEDLDAIVQEDQGAGLPAHGFPGVGSKEDWFQAMKLYNKANLLRHRNQMREAIALYSQAIVIYSFDADCYHNLAMCYKQVKDYGNAEKMYREALRLRPDSWDTWFNYANLLIEQSRYQDAKQALQQALRYNPPDSFQQNIRDSIASLNDKPF